MADELLRVRRDFVKKVSSPVLKQLLDDLLGNVLSDGEIESILEDYSSRADRARVLIDSMRKKGNDASRKMIAHLQSNDPTLYSELGLSPGETDQPDAAPETKQEWSATMRRTTESFWKEKMKDKEVYPVTKDSIRNRVALLITNIKFTDERWNRNGAEKDEENMEKLLTALGYEVVKHTNLTGKAINDAVVEFSKHPKLKQTDSVLVVVMSHGKLGAVLGVDWDWKKDTCNHEFLINNIYEHLNSKNCPALLNKPKIIIIQACRGDKSGGVLVSDGAGPDVVCDDVKQPELPQSTEEDSIEEDTLQYVPKEKDFVSLLSCTPDTVSYRQRTNGSFLIQYLVEVLNTYAHEKDVEVLFKKVMRRFEDFSISDKRQMPNKDRCSLTKSFYFFPGL